MNTIWFVCVLLSQALGEVRAANSLVFEADSLHGVNGFTTYGSQALAYTGTSVDTAGDINNDGFDDFIIGAPGVTVGGLSACGAVYVVFGSAAVGTDVTDGLFDLTTLDGTNGFIVTGMSDSDYLGTSVSRAGDFNGDGIDDIILGAWNADPSGRSASGESYVLYGATDIGSSGSFDLSTIDGSNGLQINGVSPQDFSGIVVSNAGDFNGDGFDDVLISANGRFAGFKLLSGAVYMVFGGASVGTSGVFELSAIDGSNGFVMNGEAVLNRMAVSMGCADINNDNYTDIMLGSRAITVNSSYTSGGAVYVIYGGATVGSTGSITLSALDGSDGFGIYGAQEAAYLGHSVKSAGDVNRDGYEDIIIGAYGADTNDGVTYVIYGGANVASTGSMYMRARVLDGINGFSITGYSNNDYSGYSVNSAGDFNNDGYPDLLIGAIRADPRGQSRAGETYIVFGGPNVGINGTISLRNLEVGEGLIVNGIDVDDESGVSVSLAGDINNDGFDDYLIGAHYANPNNVTRAGEVYVLFGQGVFTSTPTIIPSPAPSVMPTPAPSMPTQLPTPVPTHAPTSSPTPVPTHAPTPLPTWVPTPVPNPDPTMVPIPSPTHTPTRSPTLSPSLRPTLSPSYEFKPTPVPTSIRPSAVPSLKPSLRPTTLDTVSVSVSFTIRADAASTSNDEKVLKSLVANFSGPLPLNQIKNFQVEDSTRRRTTGEKTYIRKLLNTYWTVSFEAETDLDAVGQSSISTYATFISANLESTTFLTSLTSKISTALEVQTVNALVNTRYPSPQPTPVPQPTKSRKKKSSEASQAQLLYFALLVIPLGLITVAVYKKRFYVKRFFKRSLCCSEKKKVVFNVYAMAIYSDGEIEDEPIFNPEEQEAAISDGSAATYYSRHRDSRSKSSAAGKEEDTVIEIGGSGIELPSKNPPLKPLPPEEEKEEAPEDFHHKRKAVPNFTGARLDQLSEGRLPPRRFASEIKEEDLYKAPTIIIPTKKQHLSKDSPNSQSILRMKLDAISNDEAEDEAEAEIDRIIRENKRRRPSQAIKTGTAI